MTYIVAATGGLEAPSFQCYTNYDDAIADFKEWSDDMSNDPGNRIDLLKVENNMISVIKSVEAEY